MFKKLIYDFAGIVLQESKTSLVVGRLSKRLRLTGCTSFSEYYNHLVQRENTPELRTAVDLLTTNETFFFREPQHFEFLKGLAEAHDRSNIFRVWSAASSSGEEAYSIAMTLDHVMGAHGWEVIGTDISTTVLEKARRAHYSTGRIDNIPKEFLRRYCLKGLREQEGTLLIAPDLRSRVRFMHSNLMCPRKDLGVFDVIFLRNVIIYFDAQTKRKVVDCLLPHLRKNGRLVVGHSESLTGVSEALHAVRPTIYRSKQDGT